MMRDYHWYRWLFLCLLTPGDIQVASEPDDKRTDVWKLTFDLQPTSARLYHQAINKRSRNLRQQQEPQQEKYQVGSETRYISVNDNDLPKEWFHPYSNAVYATFHDGTNVSEDALKHPARVDFDKYRHWSRYERQLRLDLSVYEEKKNQTAMLQPDWAGDYPDLNLLTFSEISSKHRSLQQFDRYQSAPLSQGFGTHYIHLWIGSPVPQRQSVIVDTGSRFTAFPCEGCKNCGEEHHTDPHFSPSLSESFRALECPYDCMGHASCDSSEDDANTSGGYCYFSQAYTEGSSWTAYQAKDLVYCGGRDLLQAASQLDTNFSIPFMFGCLQEESGLFVTQLADGIMGLSQQEHTLPKQLFNLGKIEYNMFALCFRRELGSSKRGVTAGTMTLGGVSSTLDTSPMVYAKNTQSKGWYTVQVKRIYIAKNGGRQFLFDTKKSVENAKDTIISIQIDQDAVNSGKGVIVDSGTTDTYLNANALDAFSKVWKDATGMEYRHKPISLTQEQLQALPTVLVQFQAASSSFDNIPNPVLGQVGMLDPKNPMDVLLAIPATSYMEYMPTMKMYASRLYFTETSGGVLGANAMQGYNILFDWHHHRIGFSQSTCAYDLIEQEEREKYAELGGDANPSGVCKLGRPIRTTPCIESVDVSICQASDNPTNVKIMGTERWTRLVLDPGKELDSCTLVMEDWSLRQNIQMEPSEIKCDHSGHCEEIRPCQVPCMKALAMQSSSDHVAKRDSKQKKDSDKQTKGNCASTTKLWSACDFACEQTKISAELDDNDICVESSRDIRPCHTSACSRLDACLVPYLVQAIIILEGVEIDDWDVQNVENFKSKLASLSSRKSGWRWRRRKFFAAGDVNVLSVRPWTLEILDSTEDANVSDGIQLIIQISVFNPKATRTHFEKIHRSLLREVEAQWSNSSTSTEYVASSNCKSLDMYSLAKDAVYLSTEWLKQPKFEEALTEVLPKVSRTRVLSAWTINTQIYDEEINYFGPIGSRWGPYIFGFRLFFELIYKACFIWITGTFLFYSLDACCLHHRLFPLRQRWRTLTLRICRWWTGNKWPKYEAISTDDDAEAQESFGFELTTAECQNKGSTTPKRRNLTSEN